MEFVALAEIAVIVPVSRERGSTVDEVREFVMPLLQEAVRHRLYHDAPGADRWNLDDPELTGAWNLDEPDLKLFVEGVITDNAGKVVISLKNNDAYAVRGVFHRRSEGREN